MRAVKFESKFNQASQVKDPVFMRLFRAMQSVTGGIQSCPRGLSALYQYLTQCPPEHSDLLTLCLWDLPAVLVSGYSLK